MSATLHQAATDQDAPRLDSKFGPLLEAMPDALLLTDSQGRIVLANASAEQIFGYAKGELPGKPVETLMLPADPARGTSLGRRKDHSEFPIEITRRPVHTEEGKWILNAIRDSAGQNRLRKELDEQRSALETARQEFQAFSHSISHDLRAPLRAMDGFAAMLKRSLGANLPKDTEHALNRIQENVARMSKLIEGLLDYSTLSWLALTKRNVNPADIAQKSFAGLPPLPNERLVDFAVDTLPACEADAALLRRLFDNLISNALKYTRHKRPAIIRVGCRNENGQPVFFVQDNGVGFDMEYAGKLFQVFQRLHSPSEYEGTGIGLAIAQRIAQRHGGRVWAEAKVDQGATFYFTLGNSGYGNSA